MLSFGRVRQGSLLKCVSHVQNDYFPSLNQSDHCRRYRGHVQLFQNVDCKITTKCIISTCGRNISARVRSPETRSTTGSQDSMLRRYATVHSWACITKVGVILKRSIISTNVHNVRGCQLSVSILIAFTHPRRSTGWG